MIDEETAPLFPLLGFTAGVIEGAIALRLEYATSRSEYVAHEGEAQQFVMSPNAAIEIGRALMERGEIALGAGRA